MPRPPKQETTAIDDDSTIEHLLYTHPTVRDGKLGLYMSLRPVGEKPSASVVKELW